MPDLFETSMRWGWMDTVLRQRARDVLRRSGLSRHLPGDGLLLDLGSGTGHLSEAVLRRMPGRRCVAVDPCHAPPPRLAARMRHREFRALRADGRHLPFADGCFDAAWIGFVLHHMAPDAQEGVLAEVARVIRPGGVLVLLEDTPSNAAEYRTTLAADRRLNMEPASAPHHYRSPQSWRALLPGHGYRVEQEVAFTRLFPRATLRGVQHRAFVCRRA
jgi:ubiquinone/menaquinone biosynthesis C-methylase UbiE